MHDTLASLVERALANNPRPLEFYLREHSRLSGSRANTELANDVSHLLAASSSRNPDGVRTLLDYFVSDDRKMAASNTPSEFIVLCGIIAFGTCAAAQPIWREETYALLSQYASCSFWRIRDGVVVAYQRLLIADAHEVIPRLMDLATGGNYLQQSVAIAAMAEAALLYSPEMFTAALELQRVVLERLHSTPAIDRKSENFRVLRRTLGYTLSVITAAAPEQGFALMRECASWNDSDVAWILKENLKKKRLAKFTQDTEAVSKLLASRSS